jgi:hypothetical protein
MEIVDLAKAGVVSSSDVKLQVTAPSTVEAATEVLVSTVVTNVSDLPAAKVTVKWDKQGDGELVSAKASVGKCTAASCDLGDLAGKATAKVEWKVLAGATGVKATVTASSADGCDPNAANNSVKVVAVVPPTELDAGVTPEVPTNALAQDEATMGGGACSCQVVGFDTHAWGAAAAMLPIALLVRRRAKGGARTRARIARLAPTI